MDFGEWSDYVEDRPSVLLVRVTPKMAEGFGTAVARGAAQTQGIALPPMPHFKSSFSRMRVLCDDAEVAPIHPFRLEHRVDGNDPIHEDSTSSIQARSARTALPSSSCCIRT